MNLSELTDDLSATLKEQIPKALRSEKRKQAECTIELVTPTMARKYLAANDKNRDLRGKRVVNYAHMLRQNEWKLTSNGIGFDITGRLIDGQHRLAAIIVADTPGLLVVVRGLETESQDVMDTNLPRKLGDALKMRLDPDGNPEKYWHLLAAALNWAWRLDFIETTGEVFYGNLGIRPDTPKLLTYLDENPALRECVHRVGGIARQVPVRQALFSALWMKMAYADEELAGKFVNALATGLELPPGETEPQPLRPGNPIYALRRLLTQDLMRHRNIKMPDYREAALISKTWLLWIDGNQIDSLRWNYGPTQRDKFPIIRGPLQAEELELETANA